MPGQPKKWAVIEALGTLAVEELGEGATALDFVCEHIESGARMAPLQKRVEELVGFTFTPEFFSGLLRKLEPGARDRIAQARKDAAPQLADRARDVIEDAPTNDRVKFEKAKETARIYLWHAERLGKETYGQQAPTANVNLFQNVGDWHLKAFQAIGHARPVVEVQAPAQPHQLGAGEGEGVVEVATPDPAKVVDSGEAAA